MSFFHAQSGILNNSGGGSPSFASDPYSVADFVAAPGTSRAELEIRSAGNVIHRERLNLPSGTIGTWGSGLTISDYDFRIDTSAGAPDSPGTEAADTWISGFDGMYWGCEVASGTSNFSGTLRVRPAGGGADIDTATVAINAEST